jgi:FkbM family methyltransferase
MIRMDRLAMTAAVIRMLARRTPYLEAEMLGLSSLVGPGDVCIDVGAAAGLYTVALAQLVGPAGQVHSIEPLSFAHPVWTRVLRAPADGNVRHYTEALGAEPGRGMMSVPVGRYGFVTGRSFLEWKTQGLGSNSEFAGQVEVAVEVETLDDLCTRTGLSRLDFVKIDVEGAELRVLEGGEHAVETFKPDLLIEIEARHTARYGYSPADIVDWLTKRNYAMYAWQRGWQPADTVCLHTRNYLFRPAARP